MQVSTSVKGELVNLGGGRQLLLIEQHDFANTYKVIPVFGDFMLSGEVLHQATPKPGELFNFFYESAVQSVFRWFAEAYLKVSK